MTTIPAQFHALDERFATCEGDFVLNVLDSSARKTEGPVYFPAGRYLVWSDIPNDRHLRWDEASGAVGVFRPSAGYCNGNTMDSQGRLITCEQGMRRVTRTEHDGTITVLADRYEGRRLNSPNDVVVSSDGTIWFTDPTYGISDDYEGQRAEKELDGNYVFRIAPDTGELVKVADGFVQPNGLAFSPDEEFLYIVDTRSHPSHIRRFDVTAQRSLSGGNVFAECDFGRFDGMRIDENGRLWVAAWDGLHCFDPDGSLIGKLLLPDPVANLCFGGPHRNHLYIAAGRSIYSIKVTFNGAPRPYTQS